MSTPEIMQEIGTRITKDERTYQGLAERCYQAWDVIGAVRWRGMADGLELAREHLLTAIAEARETPG